MWDSRNGSFVKQALKDFKKEQKKELTQIKLQETKRTLNNSQIYIRNITARKYDLMKLNFLGSKFFYAKGVPEDIREFLKENEESGKKSKKTKALKHMLPFQYFIQTVYPYYKDYLLKDLEERLEKNDQSLDAFTVNLDDYTEPENFDSNAVEFKYIKTKKEINKSSETKKVINKKRVFSDTYLDLILVGKNKVAYELNNIAPIYSPPSNPDKFWKSKCQQTSGFSFKNGFEPMILFCYYSEYVLDNPKLSVQLMNFFYPIHLLKLIQKLRLKPNTNYPGKHVKNLQFSTDEIKCAQLMLNFLSYFWVNIMKQYINLRLLLGNGSVSLSPDDFATYIKTADIFGVGIIDESYESTSILNTKEFPTQTVMLKVIFDHMYHRLWNSTDSPPLDMDDLKDICKDTFPMECIYLYLIQVCFKMPTFSRLLQVISIRALSQLIYALNKNYIITYQQMKEFQFENIEGLSFDFTLLFKESYQQAVNNETNSFCHGQAEQTCSGSYNLSFIKYLDIMYE